VKRLPLGATLSRSGNDVPFGMRERQTPSEAEVLPPSFEHGAVTKNEPGKKRAQAMPGSK